MCSLLLLKRDASCFAAPVESLCHHGAVAAAAEAGSDRVRRGVPYLLTFTTVGEVSQRRGKDKDMSTMPETSLPKSCLVQH